jgi:hypothetical protein
VPLAGCSGVDIPGVSFRLTVEVAGSYGPGHDVVGPTAARSANLTGQSAVGISDVLPTA